MLANYGYIGLFIIFTVLFALIIIIIPIILRFLKVVPHNPGTIKNATFECGMETIGKTWVQFNFRYYFYALIFVALDVLVVFLYPWAVDLRKLGVVAFVAILTFILIISVGWVYAWRKKVLEWK